MTAAGSVFGRWTILRPATTLNGLAVCRCECGTVKEVRVGNIRRGLSTQCRGCAARTAVTEHGASDCGGAKPADRLYRIWKAMKWRCSPRSPCRADYFERGISVCPEWQSDYPAFRDWAQVNGYEEDLTIDRCDNDGGYDPGNCRWVSYSQQARNTRRNSRITAFGETKLACEWLEDPRCAVQRAALERRLRRGWPAERAIATPPRPVNR